MSTNAFQSTKAMQVCMAFCLFLLFSLPAHAATLYLQTASPYLSVASWLDVHDSHDDNLLPAQLPAEGWHRYDKPHLQEGLSTRSRWFRLQINNTGAETSRILQFKRASFAHIYLYSQTKQGNTLFREAGSASALQRGDAEVPGYGFRLHIPSGLSEHVFRVSSDFPLNSPVILGNSNDMMRHAQNSAGFFGSALGIIGGALFALFTMGHLSTSLRLIFISFIGGITFLAMTDRGVFGTWWLNFPNSQPLFLLLSTILLSVLHIWLYAAVVTALKLKNNTLSKHLLNLLTVLMSILLLTLVLPTKWVVISVLLVPITTSLVVLGLMIWHQRKIPHKPPAISYLLYIASLNAGLQVMITCNQAGWLLGAFEPYQLLLVGHIVLMPLLLLALKHARPTTTFREHISSLKPAHGSVIKKHASITTPINKTITVLIVEDNEWVRQVLSGLLQKLGCQTLTATNGQEALDLQNTETIDLVLMDCDMPILDGISATQLWRQNEADHGRAGIPILAVTAHVSADMRQQAEEAGMNDFIAKPVDLRLLRRALQRWAPQYH